MNLSFSTRGRLNTPWQDLVQMAKENGFSGIEVYDAYKDKLLTGAGGPLHVFVDQLSPFGIHIPVIDVAHVPPLVHVSLT